MVNGLEKAISEATEYKWATTKEEIIAEFRKEIDSIRKEFVTRELFEERMNALRAELEGKIENLRVDLEGKIENVRIGLTAEIKRLDIKLTFLIILMIVALTLMNPVVAEIIKKLLRL